jgi:hypothetical protein
LVTDFSPGLLDRYLGRTGFESQQTEEPEDSNRPFNLYEPVSGDRGAHGRFDYRAVSTSPQLWTSLHRDGLLTFALNSLLLVGLIFWGGRLFYIHKTDS